MKTIYPKKQDDDIYFFKKPLPDSNYQKKQDAFGNLLLGILIFAGLVLCVQGAMMLFEKFMLHLRQ